MIEPTYAYLRGFLDGYNVGVYQFEAWRKELPSPNAGSDYKAGYDKGITLYSDDNKLD